MSRNTASSEQRAEQLNTRAAGIIGLAVMCSRILGLAREQIAAALFGGGGAMDAFTAAFRIPNLLRDLFAEGALSTAFVTTFSKTIARGGNEAAWALATKDGKHFGADPRGGPWASVIKRDSTFAATYAEQQAEPYKLICEGMCRALFDRDTAPGAEPEDLLRLDIPALVVPGRDAAHATSAARYVEECLPRSDYWDVPVEQQTEGNVPRRIMEFLHKHA